MFLNLFLYSLFRDIGHINNRMFNFVSSVYLMFIWETFQGNNHREHDTDAIHMLVFSNFLCIHIF